MNYRRMIQASAVFIATAALLAPARVLAQPTAALESVEMKSGDTNKPVEVTGLRLQPVTSTAQNGVRIPGAYTLAADDYEKLPLAKTNRDLEVKSLGVNNGDTIVLFSKRCLEKRRDNKVDCEDSVTVSFEPCDSFKVENGESTDIRPVNVFCNQTGYLIHGGLVALQKGNGDYAPIAQIPKRRAPVMGTDAGIALTIMKEEDSAKGYEFFEGATAYYSLTRLRTPLLRLVANLSALDMDAKKDFETGLGLGVLFRTPGAFGDENNIGFGVLLGGGYNFMLDSDRDTDGNKREPWYWFVGFSWNFDRTNP